MKNLLLKIIGNTNKKKLFILYKIHNSNLSKKIKIKKYIHFLLNFKTYKIQSNQGNQYKKLLEKIKIKIDLSSSFYYNIDFLSLLETENKEIFGNFSIDYSFILNNSLCNLKEKINSKNDIYNETLTPLVIGIEKYIDNIILEYSNSNHKNKKQIIIAFENIKSGTISNMFEALQTILFYNSLLWQSGTSLNGVGRLDKILDKYYKSNRKNDDYLKEFLCILHNDFYLKSNALIGDTGQIIVLGGLDNNKQYFCNEITYKVINYLKEMQIPDPKVLLRVSNDMPDKLLEEALKSICTGIGSPLLANDEVIIPNIQKVYDKIDSYNYSTSACWEPFIPGKSFEQNNLKTFNYLIPFNEMLEKEDLNKIVDVKKLLQIYNNYLLNYSNRFLEEIDQIRFNNNCLITLLTSSCYKKRKEINEGGAIYTNYGVTSVGLSSVVNSIINIDNYSFIKKTISLEDLNKERKENFKNMYFINILKNNDIKKYGSNDKKVISITNQIIKYTNENFKSYKNYMNGIIKFGMSSPAYITSSKNIKASLDGRKDFSPFDVHISSSSQGYTDVFNFSSNIEYGERAINGNVIDLMISTSFIKNNKEKLILLLKKAIENGFFEAQMNVIDSKTLIAAKKNPKLFPNLIVRVWGFSTYFNELPISYKNLLIERAIKNENVNR